MSLNPKYEKSAGFDPVPAGVHQGICYAVVDLGHQELNYQGNIKVKPQVLIMWELPHERIEIDSALKPRGLSKKYTVSLHEKATLRKDLEAWLGRTLTAEELDKGFNLRSLIGMNCQLQIIQTSKDGKTYSNISSIMGLSKGMAVLKPENPTTVFDIDDKTIPAALPDWVKSIIEGSEEWKPSDDIPEAF